MRWRYSYAALGRRTVKSRLAGDGSVAERTVFTWDATTLVEQNRNDDLLQFGGSLMTDTANYVAAVEFSRERAWL
ncbi:hypothetical protein DEU38_12949 [Rhodococcus sp. AG1013]|uniref:hypothetical protein n=1 Tax=Rhodococcus sp. AG1013 TaxID=2183996 RepID=UPI000E0CB06E|nr:hypothetical protein [Rhodococcus sp. AG1013]RDI16200.1 hypothetical protein DEU38_12949 [Rhodococcus sp. AG1013]